MMRVQRIAGRHRHGGHHPRLCVVPSPNAYSVLIEVDRTLVIHLDPDEACQLMGCIDAALHALTATTSVHTNQLALFESEV